LEARPGRVASGPGLVGTRWHHGRRQVASIGHREDLWPRQLAPGDRAKRRCANAGRRSPEEAD